MNTRPIVTALVLVLAASVAADAQAQLFGSRSLGTSPVAKRSTAASKATGSASVGEVTGAERFIRGNRDRNDFVGTDSGEVREFIGAQGVATAAQSRNAAPSFRVEAVTNANQALKASASSTPRNGLYSPRLAVGFDHPSLAENQVSSNLTQQLSASLVTRLEAVFAKNRMPPIEVSLEDGKATLRGTVLSEHERTLAGLLALFEPGIGEVQNQLVVQQPGAAAPVPKDTPVPATAEPSPSDREPALKPATP